MTEWQKLAVKTIGDDIGGSFASNSAIATFQDAFTAYATQPDADTNWPPVGTDIIVDIITDVIEWDFVRVGANRGVSFDTYQKVGFTTELTNNGNWGLRWKMTQGSPQTMPSSSVIEGYVGLYADPSTSGSGVVQDFIALRFSWTSANVKAIQLLAESVNDPEGAVVLATFTTVWNTNETQFFELKRTSPTTMEASIYSDANYSVKVEKKKVTGISSAIDRLRFIKVHNNDGSAVGGTFNGVIDDIELFVNSEGLQDFFTAKGTIKTIDFDIFPDLLTGSNSTSFQSNFSSATGWTTTDSTKARIETLQDFLFFNSVIDTTNDAIAFDLGSPVSNSAWTMQFEINLYLFDGDANALDKVIFIGLFDGNQTVDSTTNQDGIYFAFACDNTFPIHEGFAWISSVDAQAPVNQAHDADFDYSRFNPMLEQKFFCEIKRTSATTIEASISDRFGVILQTVNGIISNAIGALQFVKIMNRQDTGLGEIQATIHNITIWDTFTNTCTFNATPVQEAIPDSRLNFCNENIFWSGIEDNSNNSLSVDLTPSNISDSGFVIRCKIDVVDNNITASNNPLNWIGLFGSTAGAHGSVPQNGIALRIDPTTGNYAPSHGVGSTPATGWTVETAFIDLTITNGAFFLEIARLSTTLARMSLYRDESFNDLIQSRTFAISSSNIDLRFWGIKNRVDTASTAFWEVLVSKIEVWDNVNNADGFPDFRMLDVPYKANESNGVIDTRLLFNSDDQIPDSYTRHTSFNGATDVRLTSRGLITDATPTDSDHFNPLWISNRSGLNKLTIGMDLVQANTPGASNVPDRTENMGLWRNPTEQINKIQVRNTQAGDYDTDSEIVVFGTD